MDLGNLINHVMLIQMYMHGRLTLEDHEDKHNSICTVQRSTRRSSLSDPRSPISPPSVPMTVTSGPMTDWTAAVLEVKSHTKTSS